MRTLIALTLFVGCTRWSPNAGVVQAPEAAAQSPRPPTITSALATASVVLTADVRRASQTTSVPLSPRQQLAKGDEVALYVDLDHEAYVYVMYVDARGEISELFPTAGPAGGEVIVPRGHQQLPPGRRWRLDAARGIESFIVLAAATPLDRAVRRSRAEQWRPGPGTATPERTSVPRVPRHPRNLQPKQATPTPPNDPETSHPQEDTRRPNEVEDWVVAKPDVYGVTTAVLTIDHR